MLQIGDRISRPKLNGFVKHVGVYIGEGLVFHNSPERNEHVSTLEEFAAGHPVTVEKRASAVNVLQLNWRVHERVQSPKTYHWSDYNCEHAASSLLDGIAESPQVQGWALLAAGLTVAALLAR